MYFERAKRPEAAEQESTRDVRTNSSFEIAINAANSDNREMGMFRHQIGSF